MYITATRGTSASPRKHTATFPLSDKEVLYEMAKYGPHCPSLMGVRGEQWDRIIRMLDMIEACFRVGLDPRILYFQPEFRGAHKRRGGGNYAA